MEQQSHFYNVKSAIEAKELLVRYSLGERMEQCSRPGSAHCKQSCFFYLNLFKLLIFGTIFLAILNY